MQDSESELLRILLLRSSLNGETEMPETDPSEEVVSLPNVYILPSLAKRGGQAMVSVSSPPLDVGEGSS
jgi:hypothetical protein